MNTLPTNHEAELVTSLNGNPFVITGPAETVTELYEAAQAEFKAQPVHLPSKAGKAAVEATTYVTEQMLEGRRATIAAKLYDLAHGRNMYGMLKQKREDERDLAMARRLGLVTTTHCQKHERALAQLKRIV